MDDVQFQADLFLHFAGIMESLLPIKTQNDCLLPLDAYWNQPNWISILIEICPVFLAEIKIMLLIEYFLVIVSSFNALN